MSEGKESKAMCLKFDSGKEESRARTIPRSSSCCDGTASRRGLQDAENNKCLSSNKKFVSVIISVKHVW